jgi:hypothetical protein
MVHRDGFRKRSAAACGAASSVASRVRFAAALDVLAEVFDDVFEVVTGSHVGM